MSNADRDNILAGIYRNLEAANPGEALRLLRSIAETLVLIGGIVERASGVAPVGAKPTQAALPLGDGLPVPGDIARRIAAAPRKWGNAVKWYDAAWREFGSKAFGIEDTFANSMLAAATNGKVGVASYARVLSALVKAGAAIRGREPNEPAFVAGKNEFRLRPPTDELREAVEAARNGRAAR